MQKQYADGSSQRGFRGSGRPHAAGHSRAAGAGGTTVGALAEPFDISLPAISKHLKVLEKAGLISRGRAAQARPARIEPDGIKAVEDWLEEYRRMWSARLDRLEDYLKEIQARGGTEGQS